jgi:hypothetical protein
MCTHARRAAVALTAALVLCIATGVSSANRGIGLDTGGRAVTFTTERLAIDSGESTITCPVTLTGTFASGFQKTAGIEPGLITSASLTERSCAGGTATLLTATLPWFVGYLSFAGTLPRISSLTVGIEPFSVLAEASGIGCLFQGTARATTGGGLEVTELRLDEAANLAVLRRLSISCPAEGSLSATFRVSPTVRLSLLGSVPAGSTVEATPNPLVIPAIDANGIIRLRAVAGSVRIRRPLVNRDVGRHDFTATGCVDAMLSSGGTCNVTVAPIGTNRPTSGTVELGFVNDQNWALSTAVSVTIN